MENPEVNMSRAFMASFCGLLEDQVKLRAMYISKMSSLSWHGVPDSEAPTTLSDIQATWNTCASYPVSHDYCEHSIYSTKGNMAFRFWHDYLHLNFSATTSIADECEIGMEHANCITGRCERLLMLADTIGQTAYYSRYGVFPELQKQFTVSLATNMANTMGMEFDWCTMKSWQVYNILHMIVGGMTFYHSKEYAERIHYPSSK